MTNILVSFFILVLNITNSWTCFYWLNNRPLTVFEVISNMWNSPEFDPVAPASECHSNFQSCTIGSFKQVKGLAPASMQSKLLRIITRWEQSGQGEGGMDAEDEEHRRSAAFDDDTRSFGQVDDDEDSAAQHCIGSLDGRPASTPKPSCVSQQLTIVSALLLGSRRHAPIASIVAPTLEQ